MQSLAQRRATMIFSTKVRSVSPGRTGLERAKPRHITLLPSWKTLVQSNEYLPEWTVCEGHGWANATNTIHN